MKIWEALKAEDEGKQLQRRDPVDEKWRPFTAISWGLRAITKACEQDRIRVKPEPVVLTVMIHKNDSYRSRYTATTTVDPENPRWEGWEEYEITLRGDE